MYLIKGNFFRINIALHNATLAKIAACIIEN